MNATELLLYSKHRVYIEAEQKLLETASQLLIEHEQLN
jgi:hypothetical protein